MRGSSDKQMKDIDLNIDLDLLVSTLAIDLIKSSIKIYACYPLGELSGSLFSFNSDDYLDTLKAYIRSNQKLIKENIDDLPYYKTEHVLILANVYCEINDFETAEILYKKIIEEDPKYVFAWVNLLAIYMNQHRISEAMNCYMHIDPDFQKYAEKEKLNPKDDAYRVLNITKLYAEHQSLDSFRDTSNLSKSLRTEYEAELRELYSFAEFREAQEALSNELYDESLINFSRVTEKVPKSDVLWYLTGKTALEGKHYIIAQEYLKNAIQIRNNVPEYWVELAKSFYHENKNEASIKALKTALSLDSSYVEGWKLAGEMILTIESQNEYEHFLEHLQLTPSSSAYLAFAKGLMKKKRFDKTLSILRGGVDLFPENERLLEMLASVYEHMMRFDEAVSIYEHLIMEGKDVQKYLKKIVSILSVLHDDKRLVKILKMVTSYLPWDEAGLWNKIGDLLMRAKDYLGASEAFRKVASFNNEDPKILFNLALAYQELKLFKKAEETYRSVLELTPKDHAALNNLGNVLKELKKYEDAIEFYQEAIEYEPEKAISWANLGILYEELKLRNEAKECFKKAKEIALKNKDFKSAAKFEEWFNSL